MFFAFLLVVLAGVVALAVWGFSMWGSTQGETDDLVTYTNDRLGFSLEHPAVYGAIQEFDHQVVFRAAPEDQWLFAVSVEDTAYDSVGDWLEARSATDDVALGYRSIGRVGDGFELVTQDVISDSNVGEARYSRIAFAVKLVRGKIYKLDYRNDLSSQESPQLIPEMINIAAGLRVLE